MDLDGPLENENAFLSYSSATVRPLSTEKNRFGDNNGANNNMIAYLRPHSKSTLELNRCCALASKTTKQSELIVTGASICSSDFFPYLIFSLSLYPSCPSAFTGEYCQYQNPCNTGGQKCQNGGTCSVVMSPTRGPAFKCTCPIGYQASFCEIAVSNNPCTESPCQNGGTCSLQSLSNYTCTCPLGWKGPHCTQVDHCSSNPCGQNGMCVSTRHSFRCECFDGFNGPDCRIDVNECNRSPCLNGATCRNTHGSYQ